MIIINGLLNNNIMIGTIIPGSDYYPLKLKIKIVSPLKLKIKIVLSLYIKSYYV